MTPEQAHDLESAIETILSRIAHLSVCITGNDFAANQEIARLRGELNEANLKLFHLFNTLHTYMQANIVRPTTPQRDPSLDDLIGDLK